MRKALMVLVPTGLLLALVSLAPASVQRPAAKADKAMARQEAAQSAHEEFAREWAEVKKEYPLVARAYLRREAFSRQAAQAVTVPARLGESGMAVAVVSLCSLYRELGLPLPDGCRASEFVRIGDIGGCFEPQPSSSGGYEMPSADEAEACVQRELQPR